MTVTDPDGTTSGEPGASTPAPLDEWLTHRALQLVRAGTTDMAEATLRVPLEYYRDPDLAARERSEVLALTPLALMPSAQIPCPYDYVVRDVLDVSVLVSRDGDGTTHAFLNYCRHRGARPASGCGSARRFSCPYHAGPMTAAADWSGCRGRKASSGWTEPPTGWWSCPARSATVSSGSC